MTAGDGGRCKAASRQAPNPKTLSTGSCTLSQNSMQPATATNRGRGADGAGVRRGWPAAGAGAALVERVEHPSWGSAIHHVSSPARRVAADRGQKRP
jgi:hypothetical protein